MAKQVDAMDLEIKMQQSLYGRRYYMVNFKIFKYEKENME